MTYDPDLDLGYCSLCRRAHELNLLKGKYLNLSFITKGWGNWRHATGQNNDLIKQERSKTHTIAFDLLTSFEKAHVVEMLDSQVSVERKIHTLQLHSICLTIKWLAKHGLALRGHRVGSSNFQSLLELLSKFDTSLNTWLKRKKCNTSSNIQDEKKVGTSITEVQNLTDFMRKSLQNLKNKFTLNWKQYISEANALNLQPPRLPRGRRTNIANHDRTPSDIDLEEHYTSCITDIFGK